MGFSYHQFDKGQTPPVEYLIGKAGEDFNLGEALKLSAGALTKCGATEAPTHICVGPRMADDTVPGTRVHHDIVYAATLTAAGADLKLGDKMTIAADGLGVTATTASGVAELVGIEGTAVGDSVRVRF